ncbi:MAG: lipoyl synthase [Lentisphaerae bacterium GWF2_45_14]|nr:MAG: lipoyl synthase [Lentisphaerae bacterium GWF2_45_14]
MTISKARPKLPPWIRVKASSGGGRQEVDSLLKELSLNTVCESARCPNLCECWQRRTATFMILGSTCTRSCKFCAVDHCSQMLPPDPDEPTNVAEAAKRLSLKYVVVTSVTRDDLPDGGASHFSTVIRELHKRMPDTKIEVLTPDFNGDENAIRTVIEAGPAVFNHNVETVERLSPLIRNRADYRKSLAVLRKAAELGGGTIPVKSGLMVGMGETDEEVLKTICDLRENSVSILTVGQYLPPTDNHWKLERFVEPSKFKEWELFAYKKGFALAACSPLVRSSYNAEELFQKDKK